VRDTKKSARATAG